jgi:biopolymer transport protein ExbB/TolQ
MASKEMAMDSKQAAKLMAGSKYTNIPLLPSLIACVTGGSLNLVLAYAVKGIFPYYYGLILERGWVQFLTVYAFWLALGQLIFKYKNIKKEQSAFQLDFIKSFTAGREVMGDQTFVGHQRVIEENLDIIQKNLILVNRINKAIKQVKINKNPADVANVLSTVAQTDAAIIDSSYIVVKFMIWMIPVLGFIGTVVGMTLAIGSFDAVLKSVDVSGFSGMKENLGSVTAGLSVAFDTTFLALVLSAIINLFMNTLQKSEENLLADIEEFTTDNIINKYSELKSAMPPQQWDLSSHQAGQKFNVTDEELIRELKNLQKQNSISAKELFEQVGRLIEVMDSPNARGDAAQGGGVPADNFKDVLDTIANVIKGQADFMDRMNTISEFIQKNMDVMGKLPDAIDEMKEASKKLGELFAKIYNRPF